MHCRGCPLTQTRLNSPAPPGRAQWAASRAGSPPLALMPPEARQGSLRPQASAADSRAMAHSSRALLRVRLIPLNLSSPRPPSRLPRAASRAGSLTPALAPKGTQDGSLRLQPRPAISRGGGSEQQGSADDAARPLEPETKPREQPTAPEQGAVGSQPGRHSDTGAGRRVTRQSKTAGKGRKPDAEEPKGGGDSKEDNNKDAAPADQSPPGQPRAARQGAPGKQSGAGAAAKQSTKQPKAAAKRSRQQYAHLELPKGDSDDNEDAANQDRALDARLPVQPRAVGQDAAGKQSAAGEGGPTTRQSGTVASKRTRQQCADPKKPWAS